MKLVRLHPEQPFIKTRILHCRDKLLQLRGIRSAGGEKERVNLKRFARFLPLPHCRFFRQLHLIKLFGDFYKLWPPSVCKFPILAHCHDERAALAAGVHIDIHLLASARRRIGTKLLLALGSAGFDHRDAYPPVRLVLVHRRGSHCCCEECAESGDPKKNAHISRVIADLKRHRCRWKTFRQRESFDPEKRESFNQKKRISIQSASKKNAEDTWPDIRGLRHGSDGALPSNFRPTRRDASKIAEK